MKSSSSSFLALVTALFLAFAVVQGHEAERYPPGVPPPQGDVKFHDPSEFNQRQAPQQQQQQQQQNIQQQQQQPPQQQQQQQQQQQHQQRAGHAHGRHRFGGEDIGAIKANKEHIRMHSKDESFVDVDQLDDTHMMAQYFRTFDLDKNGVVDGLEMYKALIRMEEEHLDDGETTSGLSEEMVKELDKQLSLYDDDNDGQIRYAEFMRNQKKVLDNMQAQHAGK